MFFKYENDASYLDRLSNEAIISSLENLVRSKNKTQILTLESGIRGIWKPLSVTWRLEVAAFVIDRRLGFGMVPPTVRRDLNGDIGSLQLFCESLPRERGSKIVRGPYGNKRIYQVMNVSESERSKLNVWDYLCGNAERDTYGNNMLISAQGDIIAIDHEGSFRLFICPNCHAEKPNKGRSDKSGILSLPCSTCSFNLPRLGQFSCSTFPYTLRSSALALQQANVISDMHEFLNDFNFHNEISKYLEPDRMHALLARLALLFERDL